MASPNPNASEAAVEATQDAARVNFVTEENGKKVFQYFPDKPQQHEHQQVFELKGASKFYDPCAISSKMAIHCMENHDDDYKEVCGEYFRAYRECKKEWLKRRKEGTW